MADDPTTTAALPAAIQRAVDETFPRNGPCGFCGDTILGARHRVIDAITERLRAGEDEDSVAGDYDLRAADLWVAVMASYEHDKATVTRHS